MSQIETHAMNTVKSFFILEFKSIGSGYLFVSTLVQKFSPDIVEIFSQAPSKLVFLFETTNSTELKKHLVKYKSKVLDWCEITDNSKHLLNALYGHTKPTLNESVLIVETNTLANCFRLVTSALENSKIEIIEIDSGRALCGKAIAFLTGPQEDCLKFKRKNKFKNTSIEILSEIPLALKSQWVSL